MPRNPGATPRAALCALLACVPIITAGCRTAAGSPSTASPATRAERTAYRETSRYADVMAFLDTLVELRPNLVRGVAGTTTEGRAIPYVIASRPRVASPAEAGTRPIVYINANIHAGEVEGKEAMLAFLRDLAADSRPNVLDSLVLLVVPIYNADGNERFGPQAVNRARQQGPELVGQRPNAQGLDLNRDYMKAEAPETRAFLSLFNAWRPDVYVDLHTTNGSYHGYALTYAPGLNPNTDPFTRDVVLPQLRERMRARHGYETFDYGNFDVDDYETALTDTVKRGWYSYEGRARYGTNYAGLRGRIGILSEAYSHDPFERRVQVTRAFVQEILSYTVEHTAEIRERTRRADAPLPVGSLVSVRSRLTPESRTGPVIAEDLVATGDSSLTEPGLPGGIRRTGRFRTLQLPIYDRFVSTLDRTVPVAYVLDAADTAAVRRLALHGIQVDTVQRPFRADVERFVIDSTWTAAREYQGHRERSARGRWRRGWDEVGKGSYVVRTAQPSTALIVSLLEPESDDGLLAWNLFDSALASRREFRVRRVLSPW